MVTPRLALRSPVAGCGKTVLLDVLSTLVARPEKSDNITTAALVRLIDERHPTHEFRRVRGDQQPHRIKDSEVANMLRDFAIRPGTIWPPNRTARSKSAKGYRRAQFEEVWRRYCADDDTPAHASKIRSLRLAGDSTA